MFLRMLLPAAKIALPELGSSELKSSQPSSRQHHACALEISFFTSGPDKSGGCGYQSIAVT